MRWVIVAAALLISPKALAQPLFYDDFANGYTTNWKPGFPWEAGTITKPTYLQVNPTATMQPFKTDANGLTIQAAKSPAGSAKPYFTGLLTSKFTRVFGYYEFTAKMPVSPGSVNGALWLYPIGASGNAEIDVIEHKGSWVMQTVWDGSPNNPTWAKNYDVTAQHTYAVDWQSDFITFYVDNVQTFRTVTPSNSKTVPMQVVLSINIENPATDHTVLPATMVVKNVGVWTSKAARDAVTQPPPPVTTGVTDAQIAAIVQAQTAAQAALTKVATDEVTLKADITAAQTAAAKVQSLLGALKPAN